jgi:hypothetical protein
MAPVGPAATGANQIREEKFREAIKAAFILLSSPHTIFGFRFSETCDIVPASRFDAEGVVADPHRT